MEKDAYFSGSSKLIGNADRLVEFQQTNRLRPITLDVSPTNQCNLNCSFCSVKERDQEEYLLPTQSLSIVKKYMDLGIKSVVLTGGGEPTLWKYFDRFVRHCKDTFQLKLGLITNGLKLHEIDPEILGRFEWIRVSMNGIDHDIDLDFSTIPYSVDLSLNYVWVHDNPYAKKVIEKIPKYINLYPRISIVKIQEDIFKENVFITDADINHLNTLEKKCQGKMIYRKKKFLTSCVPKVCYMGWIKPHLDADGQVYRCVCSAYWSRKLDPVHLMPVNPDNYPDNDLFSTQRCHTCFFEKQNNLIHQFRMKKKHDDFI